MVGAKQLKKLKLKFPSAVERKEVYKSLVRFLERDQMERLSIHQTQYFNDKDKIKYEDFNDYFPLKIGIRLQTMEIDLPIVIGLIKLRELASVIQHG